MDLVLTSYFLLAVWVRGGDGGTSRAATRGGCAGSTGPAQRRPSEQMTVWSRLGPWSFFPLPCPAQGRQQFISYKCLIGLGWALGPSYLPLVLPPSLVLFLSLSLSLVSCFFSKPSALPGEQLPDELASAPLRAVLR